MPSKVKTRKETAFKIKRSTDGEDKNVINTSAVIVQLISLPEGL